MENSYLFCRSYSEGLILTILSISVNFAVGFFSVSPCLRGERFS